MSAPRYAPWKNGGYSGRTGYAHKRRVPKDDHDQASAVSVVSLEDLLRLKFAAGREMDLADVAVLLQERRDEVNAGLAETLAGLDVLRRAAPLVPERLPEEYGWQARQVLKAWLRERGWFPPTRGAGPRRRSTRRTPGR